MNSTEKTSITVWYSTEITRLKEAKALVEDALESLAGLHKLDIRVSVDIGCEVSGTVQAVQTALEARSTYLGRAITRVELTRASALRGEG